MAQTNDVPPPPRRLPVLGPVAAGGLSLVFVSSLLFLPVLGLVVAPLGLIPVAQFSSSGRRTVGAWGWVALLLGAAVGFGAGSLATTLLATYLLLVVIPAIGLDLWARFPWSEGRWAALTAGAATLYVLVVVAGMAAPEAPVPGTAAVIREAAAEVEELSSAAGLGRGRLDLLLDTVEGALSWTLPSVPVTYLVLILFWLRPRLPLLGYARPTVAFEDYRSDEWLPAAFAAAGGVTVLAGGTTRWVALNLLIGVLILYFVHGLAIIRAHLARWLGRGWWVRWGIGLLGLQVPLVVASLGLVDSFVDLRPRSKDHGRTT